jgi:hypothetical protein
MVDEMQIKMGRYEILDGIRPFMRDVEILANGAAAAPPAPPAPLQTQIHPVAHVRVMKVRD